MQATSDKTASANFTQTGGTATARGVANNLTNGKTGYNPYFQWGRKDAFRSAQYTTAPSSTADVIYSGTSVTIGTTIKNPTTHYHYGSDHLPYASSFCHNAWNATHTEERIDGSTEKRAGLEKIVKTVYDPCPVGYTVPPANTFTIFTMGNFPEDGKGRAYTTGSGKKLYIPYTGHRFCNTGALYMIGERCWTWTGVSGNSYGARMLYIFNTELNTTFYTTSTTSTSSSRANGCPVRPVSENVRQH